MLPKKIIIFAVSVIVIFFGFSIVRAVPSLTSGVLLSGGIWNASGNVGIGTTAPTAGLEIISAVSGYALKLGNNKIGNVGNPTLDSDAATRGWANSAITAAANAVAFFRGSANSNIWSLNTGNLGIGTTAPTNALSFVADVAKKIWIENTSDTVAGKSLTVSAGDTGRYVGGVEFTGLGQTSRNWSAMAAAPNGNVYAIADGNIYMQTGGTGDFVSLGVGSKASIAVAPNGNVYTCGGTSMYMQTGGTGNFITLGQIPTSCLGITAAPNGNIYAATSNEIYMQTGGIGNFVALGAGNHYWITIAAAPNGNIYAVASTNFLYVQTGGTGSFVNTYDDILYRHGFLEAMAAAPNGDLYAAMKFGGIYKKVGGTGRFITLNQPTKEWVAMAAASNGDVYAAIANGDIYKMHEVNRSGDFLALNQEQKGWTGIAVAPNGDIYVAISYGDIYKRAGGTGNFVALGQTPRAWYYLAAAPNGNIYASTDGGDIYMQTGGTGNFVALGQTPRSWRGIAAAPNGNVYVVVSGSYPAFSDIYMQTGGTGNFVSLGQATQYWNDIAVAPDGNVYATTYGTYPYTNNIYMQTGGTGNFIAVGFNSALYFDPALAIVPNGDIYVTGDTFDQTPEIYVRRGGIGGFVALGQNHCSGYAWTDIAAAPNGDVYVASYENDIYMMQAGTGTPNLAGGDLILSSGAGRGNGTSNISFKTGTTLLSGTTMQTISEKMKILGNGNVGIGASNPTAKLDIAPTSGYALNTSGYKMWNIASPSGSVDSEVVTVGYLNSAVFGLWGGTTGGNIWSLASGNVGIGTTAPQEKLGLDGNINLGWTETEKKVSAKYSLTAGYESGLKFNTGGRSVTLFSKMADNNSYLSFETGSAATERMRINDAGYVGISTTTPTLNLSVYGSQEITGTSQLYVDNIASPLTSLTLAGSGGIVLNPGGGNVGIGTSTPGMLLQVVATSTATTTVVFGQAGTTRTCLIMYNATGTPQYCVLTGSTFACTSNSCQ